MDDLRDYRFYDEDMVHPNKQAIDYIWERFMDAYLDKNTRVINQEMEKLGLAMNHRPLHSHGQAFKVFCESQLKFVLELKTKYPYLSFEKEENYFSRTV